MNNRRFLVGPLDDFDSLQYTDSFDKAKELAEDYDEVDGDIGIWELQQIGYRSGLRWKEAEPATQPIKARHRSPWTYQDNVLLKRSWAQGMTSAQIGKALGRSKRAVELQYYKIQHDPSF